MKPSWRKPAGVLAILAGLGLYALLIAQFADRIGAWPLWAQTIFYAVAGVAWLVPMRPVLVWMETDPGDRP